uniref:Uncharacterized protein n=1 Tax=Arion vulgaris TaxID=1028688 RepID=A0A0B7APV7_9EUPU
MCMYVCAYHHLHGYQTVHFFCGFIYELAGQLKALAKSGEFWNEPITLKRPGLCTPV